MNNPLSPWNLGLSLRARPGSLVISMDADEEVERRVRERIEEVVEKRSSALKAKFRDQALKAVNDAREEGLRKGLAQAGESDSSTTVLLRDAEKRGYDKASQEFNKALKLNKEKKMMNTKNNMKTVIVTLL